MTHPGPVRVLAVMGSLMGGGAERQMVLFLKHLDRERFEPTLCLLAEEGEFLAEIPADVSLIGLGKRSPADAPHLVVRLARLLRQTRPDVVIAKVDYANVVTAMASRLAGIRAPLVLGEESVQSHALRLMSYPKLRRALLRWSYRSAAHVTAPSAGVVADLEQNIGIRGPAFHVIPNMIDVAAITSAAARPTQHPFTRSRLPLAVTAGRLAPAKGQDDLVTAIALLQGKRSCNLLVLGEGSERPRLERLTHELGIADRVAFTGFLANPFSVIAQADVFVSPSHWEAFGNVIIEAMAVGAPIVSTLVPAGPQHIVSDGENGIFARPRDPRDLADKIARVLEDSTRARALGARAREAAAGYDVRSVIKSYEWLLENAACRTQSPRVGIVSTRSDE